MKTDILKKIYRILYPYGSTRRVVFGPLFGTKYICKPSMGLSYAMGYEIKRMSFLKNYINTGDHVVDIGANCGQISLYLSKLVGIEGEVSSFEPSEYAFNYFSHNLKLNNISNVTTVYAAVSDSNDNLKMVLNFEPATGGILDSIESDTKNDNSENEIVYIKSVRLDDYCYENNIKPNFIKIDVEGAGDKVLKGATKIINEYKPYIYIEMHMPQEQNAVKEYLQKTGYKIETLEGNPVLDPELVWNNSLWCYWN